MKKTLPAALLSLLLATPNGASQGKDFSVQTHVGWKDAVLEVSISRALNPAIPALPRAETDAEAAIEGAFTGLFFGAVSPIIADSSHTIGDFLSGNTGFYSWMLDLARNKSNDSLVPSEDFRKVTAAYHFPLFSDHGIATPLFPKQDMPIRKRLGYVPTRVFSGLVIYAMEKVPAVGLAQEQAAVPALFPRIFDEDMNLVLDRSMCRPAALARWGMVGYADGIDEDAILKRAGQHPLRIAVRAVFGTNPTDLVISNEAAAEILTLAENIEILKECRILVIYGSLK
jgi:hypothetical protein